MRLSTGSLRLRLSLLVRTLVALGILGTFTLAVMLVVTVIGGFVGLVLLGLIGRVAEFFVAAPRLSAVVPVAPAVLTVGSFVATILVGWAGLYSLADRVSQRFPWAPPMLLFVWLGCLYSLVVEATAVFQRLFSALELLGSGVVVMLCLGAVLAIWSTVAAARREIAGLRDQLLDESEPAAESYPRLAETTRRLAQQADVPAPTVRITDTDRPESFTLGHGPAAVIVVSTGLLEILTDEEATAVLAHEVSHLANADSRIMGSVLVPVLMAEELIDDNPTKAGDYILNVGFGLLKWYGQFGVAILSRGREWYADAGAVALTGSPAALAAALSTLSDTRQRPSTDLREWEQSVGALDILPPSDREHATGPFRTHPSTERRIQRLRQQVVDAERR